MTTRRDVLKVGAMVGAGFLLPFGTSVRQAFARLPGVKDPLFTKSVLDPLAIPKYVTPLPNPLDPDFILVPDTTTYPGYDFYTVSQRQIYWQVLPAGFPATAVWAYGDPNNPGTFSYPGHTIEARSVYPPVNGSGLGKPVRVQYRNELPTTHLLPVDRTFHGADEGEPEVRTITHLHGAKNVGPESDGYPEAWVTPDGKTIEDFLSPSELSRIRTPFNPNPFEYPNDQEAAQLWFHDHALAVTRLNVYAGLAAFYTLRDDNEAALVTGGVLPTYPYEVPLVIQDRMFYPDGSWAYPNQPWVSPPGFEDWPGGPSILPEFFGDMIVVNGVTWPFLEVEPRKYRVRFLNGSEARFYRLFFSSGPRFHVIGTDGGFIRAPVGVEQLTIGPAERVDCIINFAPFAGQTITLVNDARVPFPDGAAVNPDTAGQIMQFRVRKPLSRVPDTAFPEDLRPIAGPLPGLTPTVRRKLLLFEETDDFGRLEPVLGTAENGGLEWEDPITENPAVGATEIWEVYNTTPDAHPIHIHEVLFRMINRQEFTAKQDPATGALTNIKLTGDPQPPPAYKRGWKDTAIMFPGEVTRVAVKFEVPGLFVWHCHILDHEDHEMMRPYHIGPLPS